MIKTVWHKNYSGFKEGSEYIHSPISTSDKLGCIYCIDELSKIFTKKELLFVTSGYEIDSFVCITAKYSPNLTYLEHLRRFDKGIWQNEIHLTCTHNSYENQERQRQNLPLLQEYVLDGYEVDQGTLISSKGEKCIKELFLLKHIIISDLQSNFIDKSFIKLVKSILSNDDLKRFIEQGCYISLVTPAREEGLVISRLDYTRYFSKRHSDERGHPKTYIADKKYKKDNPIKWAFYCKPLATFNISKPLKKDLKVA